jgi:hypothetical protein
MTTPELEAPELPTWLDEAESDDPPVVPRERLTGYYWLRYEGFRDIARLGKEPSRMHTFTTRAGFPNGRRFQVWGTADLNGKLRRVIRGERRARQETGVCVLHYSGTVPNDERDGEPMHRWLVKPAPADIGTLELRGAMGPQEGNHAQLDKAIDAAIVDDRERRRSSGAGSSTHPRTLTPMPRRGLVRHGGNHQSRRPAERRPRASARGCGPETGAPCAHVHRGA